MLSTMCKGAYDPIERSAARGEEQSSIAQGEEDPRVKKTFRLYNFFRQFFETRFSLENYHGYPTRGSSETNEKYAMRWR
jgi:hypothetical protein